MTRLPVFVLTGAVIVWMALAAAEILIRLQGAVS